MPIKRIKDTSNLISQYKLKAGKRHYFHVFLWATQEDFDKNTLDNISYESSGCVNFAPSIIECSSEGEREIVRPKLGEIHFIKKKWTIEVVAHELCHALIHRLRVIEPKAQDVVDQENESEELICYEFGAWVDQIYRLLWKDDPPPQWSYLENENKVHDQ